jgi:hypothetical protein
MKRFLFKPRFNYVDQIAIAFLIGFFDSRLIYLLVIAIVLAFVSIFRMQEEGK